MRSLAVNASVFALLLSLLLSGCGLLSEQKDETAGWSADKMYAEAKEAMNDSAYDKAVKLFEKLESRYPYGRYAQQAQLEIAYAYFKQGESASSITACDRFIRLHPNHPNVDYAYYLKGLANFGEDLGLFAKVGMQDLSERDPKALRDSFAAFKELVAKFPESKYTPDSIARMNYLTNTLAAHEVHVARYYLKRKAHIAAINRAQGLMKAYPGAPANEEALYITIKAYEGLGMKDLRDDSERVMRKNFPKSEYLASGLDKSEPWWKLW